MIDIIALRLTYTVQKALRLPPYAGGLWRSAFGARLRRRVCITGAPTCEGCPLIRRCAYGYLFNTPAPEENAAGVAGQVVHPYVLSPRNQYREYQAGQSLQTDLFLLGPACQFLPEVLGTLKQLRLHHTPVTLASVAQHIPTEQGSQLQELTLAQTLDVPARRLQPPVCQPRALRFSIEHPLWVRSQGRDMTPERFAFDKLLTSAMRRVSLLTRLTTGQAPDLDFKALAQQARGIVQTSSDLHWRVWRRYSARQQRQIRVRGLVGEVDVAGDLAALWPILWLGQWLHVGRSAVMGQGRYRLAVLA